jgi:DNA-directed RNA polymerase specialized sigma24 family protein
VAPNADAEALFAAHETGLPRYLRRAVGHVETARDLTQDVFVRIAGAGGMPATDNERRASVFRIARNLAIDHHRRHDVKRSPRGEAPRIKLETGACCRLVPALRLLQFASRL